MQPRYEYSPFTSYIKTYFYYDPLLDKINQDREARIVHTGKKGVVDAKVKKPFYRKGERW